jgi:hypothetical protein
VFDGKVYMQIQGIGLQGIDGIRIISALLNWHV